jgi:hypothetical protein
VAKHCKVITTCFIGRQIRERTTLCGDPPGPFMHAQMFPDAQSVLDLLEVVHEFELKVDPGIECDTIIVNNDVGWEPGNRYLASLDGTKTFSGTLHVITRGNFGASLGGYDFAYQRFRDRYEYWTFTEDDILVSGDQYLTRCIQMFERAPNMGFVALQGLSNDPALHAHGAVGTSRRDILDAVNRLWGYLPHRREGESQDDLDNVYLGEVLFTNLISRLGYQVVTVQSDTPLYTFAFDYMRQERGYRGKRGARKLLPRVLRRAARVSERWAASLD